MNIFLLEDDLSLRKGIALKLAKEGHAVECAADIVSATAHMHTHFDLAIIDVNLPDGNGLDICRQLRKLHPGLFILILTANDMETDIVMGYELGADDYMTKPFSLAVLLSKISAARRRIEMGVNSHLDVGGMHFDPAKQSVVLHGKTVMLTRNETRLLDAFLRNAGLILTKNQLLQALWDVDGDFVDENTLAVNIRRLREKLEDDPAKPRWIENVRGVGYRLVGDGL